MAQTPYPRTDRELLARIGRSAGGRAGYKQLVRELGLGGGRERRLLVEQLTRLVARGELQQPEKGLWALPRRDQTAQEGRPVVTSGRPGAARHHETERSGRDRLVSGRLDLHRDGFGFVRPEPASATKDDIFIPP